MKSRNEAGTHTRAQRRARLDEARALVVELADDPTAVDRLMGLVVMGMIVGHDGKMECKRMVIAYGRPALAAMVGQLDDALAQAVGSLEAAERAGREGLVKGRKLDG